MTDWQKYFDDERVCVIVPTYNNEKTIVDVLQRIQAYTRNIIVVNDGSTPATMTAIHSLEQLPEIVAKGWLSMEEYSLAAGKVST